MDERSHTAWDLAHYHVRNSSCAHYPQHQVEDESVTHQPVGGLSHGLGVLHLYPDLVLPSFLVARQRSLVLEISNCRLPRQLSSYHRSLYPAPVRGHHHPRRITHSHHPVSVSPCKGSIDWKAISDERGGLSAFQPFRGDLVLLDETRQQVTNLPLTTNIRFPDPDADIRSTMSLRDYPAVPSWRVSRIHVQLGHILLHSQIGHQVFDIRRNCIWASVFAFWEPCPLRRLARIAICRNNDLSVVCSFTGRSDPTTIILRIVVSLDPNVYVGSVAPSNVPQVGFEHVPIEDVGLKGKFEFVSSRAHHSDRLAL